ncbi:lysophospholipase L1-like esterase/pimeloyl-ACP methyl ester carboxylesterase [Pedobacter sp. CG_S7]|uniref:GDSL-type esterase/lipase family protein n=1 Tax=Pedobacter sp. CG_S7 TaxID=3143930 RepID=UPI0033941F69
MKLYKYIFFSLLAIFTSLAFAYGQVRIACIGNSITYGSKLPDRLTQSYPAQLQEMLGKDYNVMNFGVSGATLLKKGNKPYINTAVYKEALNSLPDIVLIKLGTNDTKLINRTRLQDFKENYKELINAFRSLPSKPRVILLTPVTVFTTDSTQIWDDILTWSIIPFTQEIAYEENLELIDLHRLFLDKENLLQDKVHPNEIGAKVIANRLKEQIADLKTRPFAVKSKIKNLVKVSSFYGFTDLEFVFKGHTAHLVLPKAAAKGKPWIWRARFWGHEPQTEVALLERGYHVAYCDVSELFGNKEAIELWDSFYKALHKMGLSNKVTLEGMSRGGVYIYNWAAVNPKKISCIYADNPVVDLMSWPGGFGKGPGSKKEWELFKKDFGYQTDEQAKASKHSPIDKIALIAKGRYPILHICGDKDELVPMEENTIPFEKLLLRAGGNITVIHKKEAKHHPHSLQNPEVIVDFILKANH